jgi:hypothetical protein
LGEEGLALRAPVAARQRCGGGGTGSKWGGGRCTGSQHDHGHSQQHRQRHHKTTHRRAALPSQQRQLSCLHLSTLLFFFFVRIKKNYIY